MRLDELKKLKEVVIVVAAVVTAFVSSIKAAVSIMACY